MYASDGNTPRPQKKIRKATKIINGTTIGALPYQVLLSTNPTDLCSSYHGGGVLITPNCILTAKHVISTEVHL